MQQRKEFVSHFKLKLWAFYEVKMNMNDLHHATCIVTRLTTINIAKSLEVMA